MATAADIKNATPSPVEGAGVFINGNFYKVIPVEFESVVVSHLGETTYYLGVRIVFAYGPPHGVGRARQKVDDIIFELLENTRATRELLPETIGDMLRFTRWCPNCSTQNIRS